MSHHACVQCGMCCLIAPCIYSGEEERYGGNCSYLTINDDNTTTCHNEDAKAAFIGSGCYFQKPSWEGIFALHMEDYQIDERKQSLRRTYEQNTTELGSGDE